MFRGATKVTIDDKGRVVVPAQHRADLAAPAAGRVVVTVDRDQCLRIYAFPEWEKIEAQLNAMPSLHPQARRASEASWCANEQGRFWQFHDRVYAAGADASDAALARFVREASLDKRAFETCLASGRAAASIQRDVAEGSEHGLSGTPGFFVNGRFLSGNQPVSAFAQVIDEELKDTR